MKAYLTHNNVTYDLSFLHFTLETITASQFIDFKKGDYSYTKSIREYAEGKIEDIDSSGMVTAVHLITGNDNILDWPLPVVNAIYDHYFKLFNNWLSELKIKLESKELSKEIKEAIKFLGNPHVSIEEQIRIALMVSQSQGLCNFTKDKYEFTFNGKQYGIYGYDVDSYYLKKSLKSGQVAIVQNIRKAVKKRLETQVDSEGLIEMEMSLYEMAVLAKEDGEKIPYFGLNQDRYLKAKAETFKEMLMPDYYSVIFFLTTYLLRCLKDQLRSDLHRIFGRVSGVKGAQKTDSRQPLEIKMQAN